MKMAVKVAWSMIKLKNILKVDQHLTFIKSKRNTHFTCSTDLTSSGAFIFDLVAFLCNCMKIDELIQQTEKVQLMCAKANILDHK